MTCSVCGSPKYRSGILCGACRSRASRRRARRCAAEAGLCSDCLTRQRRPGRVLCSRCARLHSASHARRRADPEYLKSRRKKCRTQRRERRKAAAAAGVCGTCRGATGRFKDCLRCRLAASARTRAYRERKRAAAPVDGR